MGLDPQPSQPAGFYFQPPQDYCQSDGSYSQCQFTEADFQQARGHYEPAEGNFQPYGGPSQPYSGPSQPYYEDSLPYGTYSQLPGAEFQLGEYYQQGRGDYSPEQCFLEKTPYNPGFSPDRARVILLANETYIPIPPTVQAPDLNCPPPAESSAPIPPGPQVSHSHCPPPPESTSSTAKSHPLPLSKTKRSTKTAQPVKKHERRMPKETTFIIATAIPGRKFQQPVAVRRRKRVDKVVEAGDNLAVESGQGGVLDNLDREILKWFQRNSLFSLFQTGSPFIACDEIEKEWKKLLKEHSLSEAGYDLVPSYIQDGVSCSSIVFLCWRY